MVRLSVEAKRALVEKALKKDKSMQELASLHNVGYSSLMRWIEAYRSGALNKKEPKSKLGQLNPKERLEHLLATASLDEMALGTYCREHGLYSHQLARWKTEFMTEPSKEKSSKQQIELAALREENKRLKQELNRKEKALAETAALLVLKKKASSLWGEDEDV